MSTLIVDAKVIGNRKPVFSDWHIDIHEPKGDHLRLRDLIACIVIEETMSHNNKLREKKLIYVLSPEEIETGIKSGKISTKIIKNKKILIFFGV